MKIDTAAILWSAPERERAGRPLLVLLHGYASHEGDLFSLSPRLPLEPVIASLRAPAAENGGFAWFSARSDAAADPREEAVDEAANAVLEWLDSIEYASVSLFGFSQGAVLALQLLRHAPERFTATVALAGFVVGGEHAGDAALAERRPPVFWGRGTLDEVIAPAAINATEEWLPGHASATIRVYEALGHSVSPLELGDAARFLGENAV